LVLVRGEVAAPVLRPDGEEWKVEVEGEAARRFETGKLAAALRKPRPWGEEGAMNRAPTPTGPM
jgi:hypothetical protein